MIGRLRGRLLEKQPPRLLLDVQGVGYEVEAPMSTFYELPEPGVEIHLYTHLVVREDAHLLYGFASEREQRLFRALLRVNGVGARMALTVLSGMDADGFARCIQTGDAERLVRLPGVGRKTADRLIVEMRDRLRSWESEGVAAGNADNRSQTPVQPADEAVSALVALGYKPQEASRYVQTVAAEGMNCEAIIREALKASMR